MRFGKDSNYPTYSLIYEVGFVCDFSVKSILPIKLVGINLNTSRFEICEDIFCNKSLPRTIHT
jgi:hypothetical protein